MNTGEAFKYPRRLRTNILAKGCVTSDVFAGHLWQSLLKPISNRSHVALFFSAAVSSIALIFFLNERGRTGLSNDIYIKVLA